MPRGVRRARAPPPVIEVPIPAIEEDDNAPEEAEVIDPSFDAHIVHNVHVQLPNDGNQGELALNLSSIDKTAAFLIVANATNASK